MKKIGSPVIMLLLSQMSLLAMEHRKEDPVERLFISFVNSIDAAQPLPEDPTEALFKLVRNADCSLEDVQKLLDRGANADTVWKNGYTPLFIAASRGNLPVCELLLNNGARLKTVRTQSDNTVRVESALQKAAGSGNLDLVKLLIRRGAELEDDALGCAAETGHVDVCVYLIDSCKMSVQAKYGYLGRPVIISAIEGDHTDCCNALLERGANACALDKNGRYALVVAAGRKNLELCKKVIPCSMLMGDLTAPVGYYKEQAGFHVRQPLLSSLSLCHMVQEWPLKGEYGQNMLRWVRDMRGDSLQAAKPVSTNSTSSSGLRSVAQYVLGSLFSLLSPTEPVAGEEVTSLDVVPVQKFEDFSAAAIVSAVLISLTKRHTQLPKNLVLKILIALQESETIAAQPVQPYANGTLARALRPLVCKMVHQNHCGFSADLTRLPGLLNSVVIELIAHETLKIAADIIRVPAAIDSLRAQAGNVSPFDRFTYEVLEAEFGKALRANIPVLLGLGKKQEEPKVVLLSE